MAFCLKNKRGLTGAPRGVDNVGGGGGLFFIAMALTLVLLPSGSFTHAATSPVAGDDIIGNGTGIGIGGGSSSPPEQQPGNCPPSPPPPTPLPHPPPPTPPSLPPGYENEKQYEAAKVIQRFGRTITTDPLGITKTWRGPKVCNYTGFRCDTPPKTKDRTIAAVDFNGYYLTAPTICGFADRLPDIALFHANSNNFSDTVPDLSNLRYLYELDLSNNRITGTIPLALGCLAKVEQLNLANNCLYGEVPDEVCRLPRLLNLSLSGNYFTGLGKACLPLLHRGVLNVRNNCIPWLPMQKPRATCAAFAAEPKYCRPITYIPCKLPHEDDERRALPTPEPSRAYAALHRNGGT